MSGIPTSSLTWPIPGRVFENQGPMRPAWDELRMNPNWPISRNDRFGTDSMIGTSQSNADRPMELDLRSRRRSVSGLDRPKAITDPCYCNSNVWRAHRWKYVQSCHNIFQYYLSYIVNKVYISICSDNVNVTIEHLQGNVTWIEQATDHEVSYI